MIETPHLGLEIGGENTHEIHSQRTWRMYLEYQQRYAKMIWMNRGSDEGDLGGVSRSSTELGSSSTSHVTK